MFYYTSQLCLTLCDPMDYTVHGILQARILEWVAFPFSRGSYQPRDRTQASCIAGGLFTSSATREAHIFYQKHIKASSKNLQFTHNPFPPVVTVFAILTYFFPVFNFFFNRGIVDLYHSIISRYTTQLFDISFSHSCPVCPTPFIKKGFLFPIVCSCLLCRKLVYCRFVSLFLAVYSVPLIFVPVLCQYHMVLITVAQWYEIRERNNSNFVLSQDHFGYLGSFVFPYTFQNYLFHFCEKCHAVLTGIV